MLSRRHHKFPRGETCSDCPARRWYLENGRRYCENGHQVEGYVQFDVDEDDNFGKTGRVARRQRQARARARKHLDGNPARELYLECLQLLLRKQVAWLVRQKGLHPELETVCRDLWLLRVRDFPGLARVDEAKHGWLEGIDGKGRRSGRVSSVGAGVGGGGGQGVSDSEGSGGRSDGTRAVMFSSQGPAAARSDGTQTSGDESGGVDGVGGRRKSRSWAGEIWPLPGVLDTLGLVYLGCVLRQEPVRIGDVFRWARNNQMPFLGAIGYIRKEWRDRLPGWAHYALLTRYARFQGSELHRAVMDLMLGYKENHGLVFPGVPAPPLLFLHIRDLALPPEVHPFALKTCRLLGLSFSFPARQPPPKRYRLLDVPDVLLVAAVVVATKNLYPLDGLERLPRDTNDPLCRRMNWTAWEAEFPRTPNKKPAVLEFEHMDPQEIWSMSKEEMNELLNWFQETQIERTQTDETDLHRLFPLSDIQPLPAVPDLSQEELEARTKRVLNAMTSVTPLPEDRAMGDEVKRLGSDYRRYKHIDELEGPAKRFYEVAAETAGLTLRDLVKAVYMLEELLHKWQRQEKRCLTGEMDLDGGNDGCIKEE
ncbi:hypothetical protein VTK26DRAFT_6517 [Humicola hyalothermophila]